MYRFPTLKEQIFAGRLLWNTTGTEGGGGGTPAPAPIPDPTQAFNNLLQNKFNNDALKLASQLFDENFQYRSTIRQLQEKAPKDGTLVLSPDDAKEYKKIKDLLTNNQLDAKTLKETLEKVPALEKSAKELGAMENLRELADIGLGDSKLKLSVLKDLVMNKYPDAEFRFVTEKDKDGKDVRNAYIKPTKDGQESAFSEFADKNLSDYLPALKVTTEQMSTPPNGNTPDPPPAGTNNGFFDRIREQAKKDNETAAAAGGAPLMQRFGRAESTN